MPGPHVLMVDVDDNGELIMSSGPSGKPLKECNPPSGNYEVLGSIVTKGPKSTDPPICYLINGRWYCP